MAPMTVVVLTYNESKHIKRCIDSIKLFTDKIVVIDSFSDDDTVELAASLGAKVYQNKWINYATQFNYALEKCPIETKWIMRLDADEIVTEELANLINEDLEKIQDNVSGIYIKRRIVFLGKWIKHGGIYPRWMLRIFRNGKGKCELRWMDEHIKISSGRTIKFDCDIVDDNHNNLCWWTEKHSGYAKREMVDLLNLKYKFFDVDEVEPKLFGGQEQRKRWLKTKYVLLPLFIRPFLHFVYVYVIRLGFLDGKVGGVWHFLQGFWYRFLVDAIIMDVYKNAGKDRNRIREYIMEKYNINLYD